MKNKKIKIFSGIGFASLIVLSVTWYSHRLSTGHDLSEDANAPVEEIFVGINSTIKSTPFIVADKLGFFDKHRLRIKTLVYPSGVKAAEALFQGKINIATGPEFVAVNHSPKRSDFQILGVIDLISDNNCIVARKDHGIRSIPDLRNRKIGIKEGSSSVYWLKRLLLHHNLAMEDIERVDVSPPEMAQQLSAGSIDAVITWYPHVYRCRQALGENAYYETAQLGQDIFWILYARKEWVSRHPSAVARVLKSLDDAIAFINTDPDGTKELVGKYLKIEREYIDDE